MSLTRCYVPLPASPDARAAPGRDLRREKEEEEDAALRRLRNGDFDVVDVESSSGAVASGAASDDDDEGEERRRGPRSLRRACVEVGVLPSADGSAAVEFGHTKVVCAVHGPRSPSSSSISTSAGAGGDVEFLTEGTLNCEVRFAPHLAVRPLTAALSRAGEVTSAGGGGGHQEQRGASAEEVDLSARLHDSVASAVPLAGLVKTVLDVHVMVLQSDGPLLPACVTAASLALADAGVEMYDLVGCCAVAVVRTRGGSTNGNQGGDVDVDGDSSSFVCLADPTEDEVNSPSVAGVVTLAMQANWKEVTFWDVKGVLSSSASTRAMELCRDGCLAVHRIMRKCLV